VTPMCPFRGFAIPNRFDNDRALLSLRFGSEFVGSFIGWGEGPGAGGIIPCWWGCDGGRGGGGIVLGAGIFGNVLTLV